MYRGSYTAKVVFTTLAAVCFIALICILEGDGSWWWTAVSLLFTGLFLFAGLAWYFGDPTRLHRIIAAGGLVIFAWLYKNFRIGEEIGAGAYRIKKSTGSYMETFNFGLDSYDKLIEAEEQMVRGRHSKEVRN